MVREEADKKRSSLSRCSFITHGDRGFVGYGSFHFDFSCQRLEMVRQGSPCCRT